ncbi:hypothetical protein EK21DRAFT_36731, partial [Setomelanomma holmii]
MCLVKVKPEEEHVVPYRVVDRRDSRRRASHVSQRRYSRTSVVHDSPRPSASYVAVPSPKPLAIPAPQPVPVFVQPPPAPMPAPPPPASHASHSHHGGAHYVEVSPRSSMTSSRTSSPGRSEYVYREREYRRERQHSPGPRYDHYRYVQPAPSESDHHEQYSRQRSRSRGAYEDPRGSFREERTRITIEDDGRRRREYR